VNALRAPTRFGPCMSARIGLAVLFGCLAAATTALAFAASSTRDTAVWLLMTSLLAAFGVLSIFRRAIVLTERDLVLRGVLKTKVLPRRSVEIVRCTPNALRFIDSTGQTTASTAGVVWSRRQIQELTQHLGSELEVVTYLGRRSA